MDKIIKDFASSTSIKPSSDAGGNKSNNENENLKSPRKKQIPTKNFMNPTISAANKAFVHKKKILGERNETLDAIEHQGSSSFGSKPVKKYVLDSDDDVEKDSVGKPCLQPYDPVKNYLSPRPKFLRYNPDRRRKLLNLQENDEDRVKISTSFDAGNGSGMPSCELQDSCSEQESVEEARDVNSEEDEDESGEECESEDDEEETVEFGDEGCCSVKGFFKLVFVVILLILTTQAICSMNTSSPSQTLDSVWGFNHSHNHVDGLNFYDPIREPVILVERLNGDVYDDYGRQDVAETVEESVEVNNAKTDDYVHQDEAENDDSNVIQDEAENDDSNVIQDETLQEDEIKASEVVETEYVEAETVDINQDDVTEEVDSDANEKDHQLTYDAEYDTANDVEDEVEKELDDAKTNDVIKFTSFDLTLAILLGHMLVLISFGAIYRSRCKKVEKEEFKNLEPSTNPQSVTEEQLVTNEASLLVPTQQNDVSKEINHVHIPSVELLGEFVFGEETTSNMSPDIQTNAVSSNQTETSHTVKKQRRKNAEVVTPSPVSVRRSSRLKTRSSVMSP